MNWIDITDEKQLDDIIEQSRTQTVAIFKHSTRCSISSMAKNRLDKAASPDDVTFYYLDLIKYRSISNKIAEIFHVFHESPQVLVINNGECTYEESHNGINIDDILEHSQARQS
jgi:bacillithiol system protein YtxJ